MSDTKLLVMMRGIPLWRNVPEEDLQEILKLMQHLELAMGEWLRLEGKRGKLYTQSPKGLSSWLRERKECGETALDIFTGGRCIEELPFSPLFSRPFHCGRLSH